MKDFKERNRGYEDSPELFMKYSRFFREVEAKKEVYLTLQQQLELARIEEVRKSPILHILDYAVQPHEIEAFDSEWPLYLDYMWDTTGEWYGDGGM